MTTKSNAMFLRQTLLGYQSEEQRIMANPRLSDVAKANDRAALKARTLGQLKTSTRALWGEVPGLGADLTGGQFWTEYGAAQTRLKAARDGADTLDPTRVQLAVAALPSTLQRFQNVGDFEQWYRQANSFERRAVQLVGPDLLHRKWQGQDGLGHVLADLQADYQGDMRTPEVQAAQAELDDLDAVAGVALDFTRAAAELAGETLSLGIGQGDFASILTRVQRGPDGWATRNPYPKFKGWDPADEEAEQPDGNALAPMPETHTQQAERIYSGR